MSLHYPDSRFVKAQSLHRAGRLADAETLYRELLDSHPRNPHVCCMLGILLCATRRVEPGLLLLQQAAQLAPHDASVQFNLASALEQTNRFAEAVHTYRQVLAATPQDAETHFRLAGAVLRNGDPRQAVAIYRHALKMRPDVAEWHNALGIACNHAGDSDAAVSAYQSCLRINPKSVGAYCNLGLALHALDKLDESIAAFATAATLNPDDIDVASNLGHMLRLAGQLDKSHAVLQAALLKAPLHVGIQVNLANVLVDLNRMDESLLLYRQAASTQPDVADVHAGYAMALWSVGKDQEALEHYRRALQLDANHPDAKFALALHALAQGHFADGWNGYEYRWQTRAAGTRMRTFSSPAWQGESLAGKRLLIHAEQGIGDEIMFASVFPEIVDEAAHVTIECSARTHALFSRSFPRAQVVRTDRSEPAWPAESAAHLEKIAVPDWQVPAGSLPRFRRRSRDSFPQHHGYLQADARLTGYWRQRLNWLDEGRKVGISWRGGTFRTGQHRRSLQLTDLLPVLSRSDVRFVSLQYTDCADEIADLRDRYGIDITHWQDAIDDYDHTAALVTSLDLVISVCTSVVHLCGALGRPVWVLAPAVPEWRYGLSGGIPWYPSARLFRQPREGEWAPVVNSVAAELEGLFDALLVEQ